jgi:hypothetical protein
MHSQYALSESISSSRKTRKLTVCRFLNSFMTTFSSWNIIKKAHHVDFVASRTWQISHSFDVIIATVSCSWQRCKLNFQYWTENSLFLLEYLSVLCLKVSIYQFCRKQLTKLANLLMHSQYALSEWTKTSSSTPNLKSPSISSGGFRGGRAGRAPPP